MTSPSHPAPSRPRSGRSGVVTLAGVGSGAMAAALARAVAPTIEVPLSAAVFLTAALGGTLLALVAQRWWRTL